MKILLYCFCLLSLCLPVPTARAWDSEGHMLVAEIAYNHLNPVAKAKCDALIAVSLSFSSTGTTNFITAASWADDFKTQLGTGNWHFIDLPFSLDGTSLSGVTPDSFDVVRALHLCVTNLQDPNATLTDQATSLRYLIHFVGDIQQPLHCSTEVSAAHHGGDAGGNSFTVTGWSNLHSLWDNGGGFLTDSVSRPLSNTAKNTLNTIVATIETDYPYNYLANTNLATIPNFMAWAQAGEQQAETNCYVGITNNTSPTAAYLNKAQALTEQLMAQGGHRLADLLNSLYPSNIVASLPKRIGAKVTFSWNTTPGNTYQVLWKQNLTDPVWSPLTNILAGSSSILFTDQIPQVQRFYRIAH